MERFFEFLDLYIHPHGRQLFELHQIEEILKEIQNLPEAIQKAFKKALTSSLDAWELKRLYQSQKKKHGQIDLVPLNREADAALSNLRKAIQVWINLPHPGAQTLQEVCFPTGLVDLTRLSYVEQSEETQRRMAVVREKHWELVESLNLVPFIEQVEKTNKALSEALMFNQRNPVTYAQVKEAKDKSDEYLTRFIIAVLGHYSEDTPEHKEMRHKILNPILVQNQAIKAEYKRHKRAISDVDPQTGEEKPSE